MIIGIGIDIVEVERIRKMLQDSNESFLIRCFTKNEIEYCRDKADKYQRFAGKFAAKEAVYKAMNLAWESPFAWKEIDIRYSDTGEPTVHCTGRVQKQKDLLKIRNVKISISHCKQYAVAVAILEGDK